MGVYNSLMLKKLGRLVLWKLLSLALLLLFVTSLVVITLQPKQINEWLSKSGIYSTVIDGVIEQSKQDVLKASAPPSEVIYFDNPDIQAAVKKAFPPEFLQTSGERIIDSTFRWLNGQTPQPDFVIDFSANKSVLAKEIGAAARKRVEGLPACPPRQLPSGVDPFQISCRPMMVGISDALVAAYVAKLQTSKDFLPKTTLTASSLTTSRNGQETSIFNQQQQLVNAYKLAKLLPYIMLGATILLIALLVFSAEERLTGLRGVGIGLIIWAVICGGLLAAMSFGLQSIRTKLVEQRNQNAVIDYSRQPINHIFDSIEDDATHNGLVILAAYGATGLSAIGASLWLSSIKSKQQNKELGIDKEQVEKPAVASTESSGSVADAKARFQAAMKNSKK